MHRLVEMKSEKNLGEFEIIVLAAILRQGEGAYGASIKREIEERSGRTSSLGALYATLTRLETKGLVASRFGEATAKRGGRAKRYYTIEPLGRAQLERSILSMQKMVQGIMPWTARI